MRYLTDLHPRQRRPGNIRIGLVAWLGLTAFFGLSSFRPAHSSVQNDQPAPTFQFTDVTQQAGLNFTHGYNDGKTSDPRAIAAGVAAGDIDGDGWPDLYVVRGNVGPNLLFRNRGDGTFEEMAAQAGVAISGALGAGPTFADFDGDGHLDLIIGGIEDTKPRLFHNQGDGTFQEVTTQSGVQVNGDTFSSAFGDYDRDGDLDLFLTHWIGKNPTPTDTIHLWKNNGDGTFTPVQDAAAGLTGFDVKDFSFTPNFADINNDGWPDLVISCDFNTSKIFLNQKDGTFKNVTDENIITDEDGMGGAVGDYDNDGDLDWFVSSIWDPNQSPTSWGITGNRLYRNRGDGTFEDVTTQAGVRQGYWGWGSCFADFDNDGNLDLFHVNGFYPPQKSGNGSGGAIDRAQIFSDDPARLFLSNGDGTFREVSEQVGVDDRNQGRGVVCFDYDRDGDVDILISNNQGPLVLYRNDGGNQNHFLDVDLSRRAKNSEAIGARIYATVNGVTQMREVRAGSNFESQQPTDVHFGLGSATKVEELKIQWPDGQVEILHNVAADQFLKQSETADAPGIEAQHRLLFPQAPTGGTVGLSVTLINTNFSEPAGGILSFYDETGAPKMVTIAGRGTDSSFVIDPIVPGGSVTLSTPATGSLKGGSAVFLSSLPLEGSLRFDVGSSSIGVLPAEETLQATVPVLTSDGFKTGLAIANPGSAPVWIRLIHKDSNGLAQEMSEPDLLNPLPPHANLARFLTESDLGFSQMSNQKGGTVQLEVTQGGGFCAMALLQQGNGTLASTSVVSGAAGVWSFDQLHGQFNGTWQQDIGAQKGTVKLMSGLISSASALSVRLEFQGSIFGAQSSPVVNLYGTYDASGLLASGESSSLGPVTLTVQPSGDFELRADQVPSAGIARFLITGTMHPDLIEGEYNVSAPGGGTTSGHLKLLHSGN